MLRPGLNVKRGLTGTLTAASLLMITGVTHGASFTVPGGTTKLDVGGYVKLDVIHNSRTNGDNNQNNIEYGINGVPLDGTEDGEEGQIIFNGRESRLWVKSSTPTDNGPLTTHLEFDFDTNDGNQGVSNSHHARIRHAYGTYDGWLFGRTWTAFMYFPALPELNDFGGPNGGIFIRQGQVRKTWKLENGDSFLVSVENPETFLVPFETTKGNALGTPGESAKVFYDDESIPDVVVRYSSKNWTVAALYRTLVVDNADTSDTVDESTSALGIQLSGWLPLGANDKVGAQINTGSGIGRYNALAATFDGYIDSSGSLEALQTTGAILSYRHNWSSTSRTNIAFGYFSSDDPSELAGAGTINKEGTSLHINYLWNPVPQLRHGIELIRAEREMMNGTEGELTRIQWSSKFSF